MQDATLIMLLRMFERVLAVLIGGGAIYLGYRLFVLLPIQTDSSGKIELPGYSVVLSKVGPGIFFAAFGSILLAVSFAHPIVIDPEKGGFVGATRLEPLPRESTSNRHLSDRGGPTAQDREQARQSLQVLNCLQRIATKPRVGIDASDVELSIRDAKVALIESVWDAQNWGEPAGLRRWAAAGQGAVPAPVRELYFGRLVDCPEQGGDAR